MNKEYEVKLPQHGSGMTEGDIVKWMVKVGDEVEMDQELAEIEAAKMTFVIPSPVSGTIQRLAYEEDDTVEVGEVIAVIQIDR